MSNNTYPWWLATSISVSNGSTRVIVNSGEDTAGVMEHDALLVIQGDYTRMVEVRRALPGELELISAWPWPDVSALSCKVMPTAGDFQAASAALRDAKASLELNFKAIEDWGSSLGYVTYTSVDGTEHQARTMRQMDADFQTLLDEVQPFAVSIGEMEAMRNTNRDLYAASGFVHMGKHVADTTSFTPINEGLYTNDAPPFYSQAGQLLMGELGVNKIGSSKTDSPVIHIAGFVSTLLGVTTAPSANSFAIQLPPAPDGTVTYDSATGVVVQHADAATAFAAETATNKVVTERVDMYGLEYYLELITPTNPQVSPYGCIQTEVTIADGVATQAATRTDTYYHVFTGDTAVASDYREWNWFALSNEDRAKILANPEHHIYYVGDGNWVQWKIRQRSVAGAGNGNWFNTDSTFDTSGYGGLQYSGTHRVWAQAGSDISESGGDSPKQYRSFTSSATPNVKEQGVFTPQDSSVITSAYNGECYFLVLGTVQRLNQGAYHPSFNKMGAGSFIRTDGAAAVSWAGVDIANSTRFGLLNTPTSTMNCFTLPTTLYPYTDGYQYISNGQTTRSGAISRGSVQVGRPDGKFYDAIYASGQGGVIDDRLEAVDNSSIEKASEIESKVRSGVYRGVQKLPWTWVQSDTATSGSGSSGIFQTTDTGRFSLGDIISIVDSSANILIEKAVINSIIDGVSIGWSGQSYGRSSGQVYYAITMTELDISVEGNIENGFSMMDVVGDPANILATPDLTEGWLGGWINKIPDGTSQAFPLTRRALSIGSRQVTTDLGSSWTSYSAFGNYDSTTNTENQSYNAAHVWILNYQACPYVTEKDINRLIENGDSGLLGVTVCGFHDPLRSALLQESLIQKVNVNGATGGNLNPVFSLVNPNTVDGMLDSALSRLPEHVPLLLQTPNNDSPSVKSLAYQTEENKGLYFNFAYNEIKHDGTDWGDDSTIKIANGQSTYTNLNGETCLYGTNRLTKRYGWKK